MSSTTKSAVSDYEHLKYQSMSRDAIDLNESDDDELFLKAPTPIAFIDALASVLDENNSNSPLPRNLKSNSQYSQFEAVNKSVPVPTSWSPRMTLVSNPSLLITPDKPVRPNAPHAITPQNESFLETQKAKQIPQPIPWSPGMRPEKSIFITPEKSESTWKGKPVDSVKVYEPSDGKSPFPTLQGTENSGKEKQTVRFDLPSLSSGDDTFFDENSSLFSPVTIKGKDMNHLSSGGEEFTEISSVPSWKSSSMKSYNPEMYSDDSMMDDSVLASHKTLTPSAGQNTDVSLSTSVHLVNKLKELMQDTDIHTASTTSKDIPAEYSHLGDYISSSMRQHSIIPEEMKFAKQTKKSTGNTSNLTSQPKKTISRSSDVIVIKESQSKSRSNASQSKPNRHDKKAGPHFLRDPISVYHPPSSGSCIVKEPHRQVEAQEYSYPFRDETRDDKPEIEHAFARPEFNSTLKFRQELDNMCDLEVDVVKAVNEKLKVQSERRTEIQEKAAVLTNCPTDLFSNLVDLEPPVDRLCDRVVKMRTSKTVRRKKIPPQKTPRPSSTNVPDLMEFYSTDLQKEMPGFSLQGISAASSDLQKAPKDLAFDVYRHNRVWDRIRDF